MKISIVSPVYMGEQIIQELIDRLNIVLPNISRDYEIILVEDNSPDNSWEKIEKICEKDNRVKGVKLSRNFGQHYAITCGLELAEGDWIVVMDCDLQDQPEEILKLFDKTKEGYDIVFAQRENRQDTWFKKLCSNLFYKVFSYLTDTKQDATVANFGIYSRTAIQSILLMKDYIRYFPTMIQWVGFNHIKVRVEHSERLEGKSSYTLSKLLRLAFDNIISFSNKPLRIIVKLGFYISLVSFITGLFYLYKYFTGQITVLGFSSIIITITFLSGIIILIMGVVGVYIGKTFEQSKDRPVYIVQKKLNY